MELRVVETVDARRVAGLDLFIAATAIAVLISLFLPWFLAEYEPHVSAARACFSDSHVSSSGTCVQSWNGWRTISLHWALPVVVFVAYPQAAVRILGERRQPKRREPLTLSGALLAVVVLGFFLTPDLTGLNEAQAEQAALYAAEAWVYTSVTYTSGIFSALGFAFAGFVAGALRSHLDPAGVEVGRSHGGLIIVALVLALLPIAYLGEILTRF